MAVLDIFVLGLVAVIAVLVAISILIRRTERAVAREEPCRSCGYSMLGAASDTCPECGAGFDPSDKSPYVGRSRARVRAVSSLILGGLATIAVANVDLPTYRVFQVDMHWVIQEVGGDTTFDHMEIVGRSDEHAEWSLVQSGERGGSGGGLPPDMPAGVSLDLTQVEFLWRNVSLVVVEDPSSGNWVDADGASIDASGVRRRLQAPSEFDRYVEALLTMDWYNGRLRSFYESEAFHPPGDYGPGTANPSTESANRFTSWGTDGVGTYTRSGCM